MTVSGVNKHFQMLMILERFCSRVRQDVPVSTIWERLNQLYDMPALVRDSRSAASLWVGCARPCQKSGPLFWLTILIFKQMQSCERALKIPENQTFRHYRTSKGVCRKSPEYHFIFDYFIRYARTKFYQLSKFCELLKFQPLSHIMKILLLIVRIICSFFHYGYFHAHSGNYRN